MTSKLKDLMVRYIHPANTNLIDSKKTYRLEEVVFICDKYKNNYKIYFQPTEGLWEDYEEKPKRKYTKKSVDNKDNKEEVIEND